MKDVISAIQAAMYSDDENDSARLIGTYEAASPEHKAVIDDVLITICGYSMPTLLDHAEETE
jgi:hypothetical protein